MADMDPFKQRNMAREYPSLPASEPFPFPNEMGGNVSFDTLLSQAAYATCWNQPMMRPTPLDVPAPVRSATTLTDTWAARLTTIPSPPSLPDALLHHTIPVNPALVFAGNSWMQPADRWDEIEVTGIINHMFDPIYRALVGTADLVGTTSTEKRGDKTRPDLVFRLGVLPDATLISEFKSVKTTLWTGWVKLDEVRLSTSGTTGIKGVLKQVARQAQDAYGGKGDGMFMSVMAVAPTHLRLGFWNVRNKIGSLGITKNLMRPLGHDPNNEVLALETWKEFYCVLFWAVFAWLVHTSPNFKERWSLLLPDVVKEAEEFYALAGEAKWPWLKLKLMTWLLLAWQWISLVAFKRLPLKHSLKRLRLVSNRWGAIGMKVTLETKTTCWAPLAICLEDVEVHDNERSIYHFLAPDMVWKIYPVSQSDRYEAELAFYQSKHGLDEFVPELLANGTISDGRPVLILSCVGHLQAFKDSSPTQQVREKAKALVEKLHAAGWHHHDLWEGNFIANEAGRLSLIDFESAEYKGTELCKQCPDLEWKSSLDK